MWRIFWEKVGGLGKVGKILSNDGVDFAKRWRLWGKFKEDFKKRIILVLHGTFSCKNRIMVARMMLYFQANYYFYFSYKVKIYRLPDEP